MTNFLTNQNVMMPTAQLNGYQQSGLSIFNSREWMFKPKEVKNITTGNFKMIKRVAEQESKWLAIFLLDPHIFQSQTVPRDYLSNKELKEIFDKSFIIYISSTRSIALRHLKNIYNCQELPMGAIIDPRTGKVKCKLSLSIDRENFDADIKSIKNFISRLPYPGYRKIKSDPEDSDVVLIE